jgi:hypothetical protein
VLKIASHGPAGVEGGSTISRDRPAQVNDRGRRRDEGAGFTLASSGAMVKTTDENIRFARRRTRLADLLLSHLADALGRSAILSKLDRRHGRNSAAPFLFA